MSKPLHKDPSFWIVVVTLIGAANVAQFYFGVPWLREKVVASRPAPRATNAVQVVNALNQPANLDYGKKTYSWQRPRSEPRLLQETPPQVVLIPSEYAESSGGWGMSRSNSAIGIRMQALYVVRAAYGWTSSRRMISADQMPTGQFDFIANLPSGALEGLQAEIKTKWGLVAERETRPTNVVFLKLDHTNAPGLTPATRPTAQAQNEPGMQTFSFQTMNFLASYLETVLQVPVIDQTELTGFFDIRLPMIRPMRGQNGDALEQIRKVFIEQLGLQIIQTNAPVEMLVVKKVNGGNP